MFNVFFFFFLSFCVSVLIMSNRIKDGIVVKSGMILIAVGFFGAGAILVDQRIDLLAPLRLIGYGSIICLLGIFFRGHCDNGKCRRVSDWFEHQTTPRP